MSCFMNNHFSIGKLHNSFGNLLFICFRNFGKTFDENWMMKILDEKIYVLISKDDRCYRRVIHNLTSEFTHVCILVNA